MLQSLFLHGCCGKGKPTKLEPQLQCTMLITCMHLRGLLDAPLPLYLGIVYITASVYLTTMREDADFIPKQNLNGMSTQIA